MSFEKEHMLNVARKQKDCNFSLRFILQKHLEKWDCFCIMLRLVKKEDRVAVMCDYGDHVLGERFLSIEEGVDIISRISSEDATQRKLAIPDYSTYFVEGGQITFAPSKPRWGWFRSGYPTRYSEFTVKQDRVAQWNRELVKEKLPYYPSLSDAAIDFLGLAVDSFSSSGKLFIVVPDYRAQINSLKLSFSTVEVTLKAPEINWKNLVLKVFAKSGVRMFCLPDIIPESKSVMLDFICQPDFLSVVLLSHEDGIKIDEKEFSKSVGEEEGVFLERPSEEIISLTEIGEGQDLEYKREVSGDLNKNDLIESVVAFLNTNRGTILVGVDDKGEIAGHHTSCEDIDKMIHDSIDPPPEAVRVEEKEVEEQKVIVIEVPEGSDKPYQSKRDKNWYVRHNASDMRMERSELMRILEERKRSNPYDTLTR
jgi:hypothetical protein